MMMEHVSRNNVRKVKLILITNVKSVQMLCKGVRNVQVNRTVQNVLMVMLQMKEPNVPANMA